MIPIRPFSFIYKLYPSTYFDLFAGFPFAYSLPSLLFYPLHRDRDVREFFEKIGPVKSAVVGMNKNTGQSKGYAFVHFEDRRDAEEAFNKYV